MAAMEQEPGAVLEFGPFCFDLDQGVLSCEGRPIRLAPKEIETLRVLLVNAGRLVSKEEIIAKVWPDAFVSDDSLTRCVYVVRRALGDDQNGQQYIETLAKRGYRFVAPVSVRAGLRPAPGQVANLPLHAAGPPAPLEEPTDHARIVRFEVFEVALRSGGLRKQGLKVKLQEQPFQILTMLLERPGEVVSRDELCKKLWPEDTFVDFDNSLNTGINKIREALGDFADNPRFVETLPRRGYRFIYPVAATSSSPDDVRAGLVPAQGRPQGAPLQARWRLALVAGLTAALALAIAA